MTLKEAIKILRDSGVDSPDYDARELFRVYGNLGGSLITMNSASSEKKLEEAVLRRAKREPLQYIIGRVGFYREEYTVTPDCLIPRSDTEILVDYAVRNIPAGERFADLCSGSGCVGISTLRNTKDTVCTSFDVSDGALSLTYENARLNSVEKRITVIKKDLLTEDIDGEYFAILSNPPYIPKEVYRGLAAEIFSEPEIAFVGGDDGLIFYKKLIPVCRRVIKDGGFIAFEIGYDQAESLHILAKENSLSCEIIKDYSGNDRVAILRK